MTVQIAPANCTCSALEPACARVCPGNLLARPTAGAPVVLREATLCWDCAACVKACRRQALTLVLPPVLGGRGASLTVQVTEKGLRWLLTGPDGRVTATDTPGLGPITLAALP